MAAAHQVLNVYLAFSGEARLGATGSVSIANVTVSNTLGPAKRAVMFFGWVFFLVSFGGQALHVLRAHRGRTCGEPNENELAPTGVEMDRLAARTHVVAGGKEVVARAPHVRHAAVRVRGGQPRPGKGGVQQTTCGGQFDFAWSPARTMQNAPPIGGASYAYMS